MNRLPMSPVAAALLRSLIARAGIERDRILLTEVHSSDWQSLTFVGERHCFGLRIIGSEAEAAIDRICSGLEDAEFNIRGQIVADVAVTDAPSHAGDGSMKVTIEALTVEE